MKRKTLTTIVIIMSFAIIGLIAIQAAWLKRAVDTSNENFESKVNKAISNVIYRVEKYEVYENIIEDAKTHGAGEILVHELDSLTQSYYQELGHINDSSFFSDDVFQVETNETPIDFNVDGEIVLPEEDLSLKNNDSLTVARIDSLQDELDDFFLKSFIVSDVISEVFYSDNFIPIEKRLNFEILDSLIHLSLETEHINIDYEYAIYCPRRNIIAYQSDSTLEYTQSKNKFIYNLYPRGLYKNPEHLIIVFPKLKYNIFDSLGGLIVIAPIIILIIAFTFIVTISSLLKQKKLTDLKNDFINNMTHEIKTPISTISLACQSLKDDSIPKTPDLVDSFINMIDDENDRLADLADNILQIALIDNGQLRLKMEWVDINDILIPNIEKFNFKIQDQKGKITTEFFADNTLIYGDKTHLINVFQNLFDNSLKYSNKYPYIVVKTENVNDFLKIIVKDNGIGISKSNQKRIFDNLYRVPTGNLHDVKGFGLGLAYVKNIVDKHNGKIEIESELKKGTSIIVYLPNKIKEEN